MDTIVIEDLEVSFRVGVPDEERAAPQRLLISVELDLDTREAAAADSLDHTVNYFEIYQRIQKLGEGREWKLIETLAHDVAGLALDYDRVQAARVSVKKFILPEARHVAVRVERRAK
jgi:FolB domain-containing protein